MKPRLIVTIFPLVLLCSYCRHIVSHVTPVKIDFEINLKNAQRKELWLSENDFGTFSLNLLKEKDSGMFLTGIDKLIKFDSNYYIFDKKFSRLAKYKIDGKFVTEFGKFGNSGTDHRRLSDFDIDTALDELLMLDNDNKNIIFYSLQGKYKKRVELNVFADKIACVKHNNYLLYLNYNSSDASQGNNIVRTDTTGTILDWYSPFNVSSAHIGVAYSGFLKRTNSAIYMSQAFDEYIYEYNEQRDAFSNAIKVDLTDDYERQNINNIDLLVRHQVKHKNTSSGFLGNQLAANSTYIVFTYAFNNTMKWCIYNKKERRYKIFDRKEGYPLIMLLGNPVYLDEEDNLYFAVAPQVLKNLLIKESNKRKGIFDEGRWLRFVKELQNAKIENFSILKIKIIM